MEIIKRWLKDRVGLEVHPQLIDAQFANGYRLGQVLEAYGLQTDLDRFINKDSPDAKLSNFQRLQPVFRELNIKFDSHTANQLMTEEPGIAMQLLQQMKVKLDVAPPVGARAPTGRSRGSTALLLTTNRMASKSKFKEMEEATYERTLRLKTADPREFRMANHLRAFEEEAIRQQREAEVMDALDMMTKQQRLADGRDMLRTKLAENRAYLQDWEREGKINHAKNQATARERERRDLRLELAMREKARRTRAMESDTAAEEMATGIDVFEDSLRRMQDVVDEPVDEALLSKTATESPHEFLQSLASRVPRSMEMQKESEQYLNKVKERRMEDNLARKERDRRRRRVLVEQMRTHKDMEAKKKEEMMKEKLLRQSEEEQRIAERLNNSLANKEQMRRERLAREQQYRAAREQQLQLTRQRDVEVYGELRKEYLAKLEQERGRLEELNRQRDAARFQKHYHLCRAIVDQVVDLTAKTCEYRAVTDAQLVPAKQWREWLVTFSAGLPLYPDQPLGHEPPREEALPAEEEKIAVLQDAREYNAYLDQEEEWAEPAPASQAQEAEAGDSNGDGTPAVPEPEKKVTGNQELGAAVKLLRKTVEEAVEAPVVPPGSAVPRPELRLAVTGAPLAGVSRQADKLAEQFELAVIRVQAALAEGIKEFESKMQEYDDAVAAVKEAAGEEEPEAVEPPDLSPLAVLGGRAREAMKEGQPVSDEILVDLIIEQTKELGGRGYVLDGFPATVDQARVLHRKLAGVHDVHLMPKPQPPSSRLAPQPGEQEVVAPPVESGLTLHVRVHVDKELSLRRRLGRLVDPQDESATNASYHLEFDPPPESDSALCARLVPAPDNDNADLLTRITAYTDERALLDSWLSRFGGASVEVNGTESVDEVSALVQAALEKRIQELTPPEPAPAEEEEDAPAEQAAVAAEGEGEEEPAEGEEPPPAPEEAGEGGTAAKPFEPVDVHVDVANMLLERWQVTESQFEQNMRRLLRAVRDEHRKGVNWIAQMRNSYMDMLRQPKAEKQKLVHAFQVMFNSIDMEVRQLEETKNELHERTDDLRNSLWEIADEQREAAEGERAEVMEDTYVADASSMLVSNLVEALQHEVHRYQATESILRDVLYTRANKQVPVETRDPLNLIDKFLDGEFAGNPLEVAEPEDESVAPPPLTDHDKEVLGQLQAAVTMAIETLCDSPPFPEPGTEADAEGDAAVPGLLQGIKIEEELLKKRGGALVRRGRLVIEDMRAREAALHRRMDVLLGERFRGEMEGIEALTKQIKRSVEAGGRLHDELSLIVKDFVRNEDSLTYAILPKPPPLEPRQELAAFELSTAHLAKMAAWLRSAAPSGQILVEVMVSVLHRAAAVAGIKLLPAEWIPLPPSKLRAFLVSYETGAGEGGVVCLDWRRVMWSLANVPPASVEELRSLVQRAKNGGASLDAVPSAAARALPLWFEGLASPATYTDSNGQVVVKGHEPAKLKGALMDIFTVVAADGRSSVNLLHLILYACADKQKEGVEKAVKVLGSTQGHMDAETLLPILSLASLSCMDKGAGNSDTELVDKALAAAAQGKEAGTPITVDMLMQSPEGLALVSCCQGLEAKEPYKMLAKLAPPIPSAPPPPQEGEE